MKKKHTPQVSKWFSHDTIADRNTVQTSGELLLFHVPVEMVLTF